MEEQIIEVFVGSSDTNTASGVKGEAYRVSWNRRQDLEYLLGERDSVYFSSTKIDPRGNVIISRLEDKSYEIECLRQGKPSSYRIGEFGEITGAGNCADIDEAIGNAKIIKEDMLTAYAGVA